MKIEEAMVYLLATSQPGYLVNKLDILSTKWTFCHPSLAKKSISDALAPALQYP